MRIPLLRALLWGTWVFLIWGCEDQEALDPAVAAFNTDLVSFDGQMYIAEGTTVDFLQLSGNASSWYWTFEGGSPGSYQGRDPSAISYYEKGEFDVQLIVNQGDALTADTLVKEDYIKVVSFDEVEALVKMEYHADGKLTVWNEVPGRLIYSKLVENGSAIYGTVYSYDAEDRISWIVYYPGTSFKEREQLYEYDVSGKLTGYRIVNGFGEIEETLTINYTGEQFTSADLLEADGQGGFIMKKVTYIRDFENDLFIEVYRDPLDDSFLGSVKYTFGENRNPYYNMGTQPFPVSEFKRHVVKRETIDASGNLVSVTTEEVLETDQFGLPVNIRRVKDGMTVLEVTRSIEYTFD